MKSRIGSMILFVGVVVIGVFTIKHFWKASANDAPPMPATSGEIGPTGTLQLTSEKTAAAGIRVVPVSKRALKLTRAVPGRIQYDDTRHVAVKAATAGALEYMRI